MIATSLPSQSSSASDQRGLVAHGLRASSNALALAGRAGLLLVCVTLGARASLARASGPLSAPSVQAASLAGLENAMQERLDEVSPLDFEARRLEDALRALRAYSGSLASYAALEGDPRAVRAAKLDMDRLRDVAGFVEDSRTPDADIHFQMGALRDTLLHFGSEVRQAALGTLILVGDADERARLEELVASAEPKAELGTGLFGRTRRYRMGARLLAQAASIYYAAHRQADELRIKEAQTNPVDLKPVELMLPPETEPKLMIPFDVTTMVELSRPAPEVTVAVRAISVLGSDEEGAPPRRQVTLGTKTFLDVPAGMQALPVAVEIPPFTDESEKVYEPEGVNRMFASAIDGDTAVVGRPSVDQSGEPSFVSVLERNAGGFEEWNEVARLDVGVPFSLFGASVALSGNSLVVGAPGVQSFKGAAYVYQRQGGTWVLARTLQANNGASLDGFGSSVAIDGDWIIVGAPGHESGVGRPSVFDTPRRGTAYTFRRDAGDPTRWIQVDSLAIGLEEANVEGFCSGNFVWPGLAEFGAAVAIHGNLALVGDPLCRTDYEEDGCLVLPGPHTPGAAFVFELVGGHWRAIPGRGWLGARFNCSPTPCRGVDANSAQGSSVAIADQTLVVGAPGYSGAAPSAGVVRVYSGPPNFTLTKTVNAPSPIANDNFGVSVAISRHDAPNDRSQMIVVGSPGHDHPNGGQNIGSAYVFVRGHAPGCPTPMPLPGGWGLAARLGGDPRDYAFGRNVAVTTTDGLQEVAPTILVQSEPYPTARSGELYLGDIHFLSGMEPVLPGEYWLETELDPHDRILELADDAPGGNVTRSATPATFCVECLNCPDLAVDSVQLVPIDPATGKGFLNVVRERDINNNLGPPEQRGRAGLNVTVRMAGMFDGPLSGTCLTASANGPGFDVPFHIWNSATSAYESSLVLPDMSSGETISLQLDVELQNLTSLPTNQGGYPLNVRVSIAAAEGVTDVDTANNARVQTGQSLRVLEFLTCNFAERYGKQLGNGDFNVTVDFMGALNLDAPLPVPPEGLHGLFPQSLSELGASGGLTGGASLTLMGQDLGRLADFRALAERDPVYAYDQNLYPGMDPGYQFIGFDLRVFVPFSPNQLETVYAIGPYDTFDTGALLAHAPPGVTVDTSNGGFRLSKDFSIFKGVEKEKTFYPGGVPVTVMGRAQGRIGFQTGITVANALRFDVGPFVDFSGGVSLALGDCHFACVGAEGELVLVKDTFNVAAGLGITVIPPTWFDDPDPLSDHSLGASACFRVTNNVTLLSGSIKVFAVFPWFKWCRVLGVPLPCGFYIRKEEFPIIDWAGISNTQVIFDRSTNLCCTPVVGILQCGNSSAPCR